MSARRVLVVWVNPLFRDSVLMLLRHPDVECVGVIESNEVVPDEISSMEPDTILVEEAEGHMSDEVMDVFEGPDFRGRLVSFSMGDNRLRVYHREEWAAVQAEDLLHLILS